MRLAVLGVASVNDAQRRRVSLPQTLAALKASFDKVPDGDVICAGQTSVVPVLLIPTVAAFYERRYIAVVCRHLRVVPSRQSDTPGDSELFIS